ncbi:hypothetical protein TNCV_1248101 [Trichonephila clavipes]|nr:hypothetical protein TNCV_1248101 [Trichonephila clavipes]
MSPTGKGETKQGTSELASLDRNPLGTSEQPESVGTAREADAHQQSIVNEVFSEVVNEINSSSEMRKTVKINGYDFDALIDTGSTITLIRESVHQILGRPTLNPTKINLTSFEDKCKNLEMHVSNTSTLSLEKTALLNKLHKLEESNLEKVDKLVKLEEKYEILQETLKITEQRLVEKEIECASLTEKYSSGRNANKTSDSDENQAFAKEKNDLLRQIDFLNSIILDTKLKEPNKSKAHFVKKRKQHIYKKDEPVTIRRTQFGTQLKLRPKFCEPYLIKTVKPHDRNVGQHEGPHLTSTAVDFMKRWSTADA